MSFFNRTLLVLMVVLTVIVVEGSKVPVVVHASKVNPVIAKPSKHSTGQITLFLQKKETKAPISQATVARNRLVLQDFLQQQGSPLYQKAISIINKKQLQEAYQRVMVSIQFFFVNYSAKVLQHFHVGSSKPTHSLSSFLSGLSTPKKVVSPEHGNELAAFLSSLSKAGTKKQAVGVQGHPLVLPKTI